MRQRSALLAVCAAAAWTSFSAPPDPAGWCGFNLLEKFTARNQRPFVEDDFRWIAELGFNFVRLPMDYRCYAPDHLSTNFNESVLREIDQAVEFGRRYRIHVCINLHRAPGFCINPPPEPADLWTDEATQQSFVRHWEMFARRYRGVPAGELSFNLLNEPARTTRERHVAVHARAIEAIHAIDPERPVIVDGYEVGRTPCEEFLVYSNVIQATRGYHPATISHYRASWVRGSDRWPVPTWPELKLNGYLYGPVKPDYRSSLVLTGAVPAGTTVELDLVQISGSLEVAVCTNGVLATRSTIAPAASPRWERDPDEPRWPIFRARTAEVLRIELAAPCSRLEVRADKGDWLLFRELRIQMPGRPSVAVGAVPRWGETQQTWAVAATGALLPPPGVMRDQPLREYLAPWLAIRAQGEEVFVGEFGCFNKTPHAVALAWLEDWLRLWQEARIGWAMWNFRGSFGPLDSGRADVQYEEWHGHKLDRAMLDLLRNYRPRVR
ncbi:MAG: cellulase family glycosylhydrolase [Kiritimatiellae bacterium]|nr:cellulase family glycosylhydrolase [Kiritimatiellia bacterium]